MLLAIVREECGFGLPFAGSAASLVSLALLVFWLGLRHRMMVWDDRRAVWDRDRRPIDEMVRRLTGREVRPGRRAREVLRAARRDFDWHVPRMSCLRTCLVC